MHSDADRPPAEISDERRIMDVGNSLGMTLPPMILDALDLSKGDDVVIVRRDGESGFEVRPTDSREHEFAEVEADD